MSRTVSLVRRALLPMAVLATSLAIPTAGHALPIVWSGTVSLPNGYTVPAGQVVELNPLMSTTVTASKNIIVKGTLRMRPAGDGVVHTLRFTGFSESAFVGGGDVPLASDVGLWVTDAGVLDVAGRARTGWSRASSSLAVGATSVSLSSTPVGWRVGDEILVAPTEKPTVSGFSMHFELRTITSISGSTIGFGALSYAHPRVTVRPGVAYGAEIANLTRNVRIEGQDATHRSHVWLKSSVPQTIRNASIRYMGPQRSGQFVKGRYGLHFHKAGDGSRGSLVESVVVRQAGSHAFVPHASHGITFRDTVAFDATEAAYWYDPGAAEAPDDTLYERALSGYVRSRPNTTGHRNTAFSLGQGTGNGCLGCVAFSVQGGKNASGYLWPENEPGVWLFQDSLVHNNRKDGIFVWQNTSEGHDIDRFVAYHNGDEGIEHGAYTNRYRYADVTLYGNLTAGVSLHSESRLDPPPTTFARVYIDGAGITRNAYQLNRPVAVDMPRVIVCETTILGLAPGGSPYFINYVGADASVTERLEIRSDC